MFEIATERLRLIGLDGAGISLFIENEAALDLRLGLAPATIELPEAFRAEIKPALEEFCLPNIRANADQYLWYTHWLIIHREQNLRIGGVGSSGPPNEIGEVMIGYYISRPYTGQGFAVEASSAFCRWLETHPHLKMIIATTPVGHHASERVLQKIGFTQGESEEEGINRWELKQGSGHQPG